MPLILPFYLEFSAISRAQSWAEAYPIQLTVVLRWGKEKKDIKRHDFLLKVVPNICSSSAEAYPIQLTVVLR